MPEETDYKLNISLPQLLTCWNGVQCNVTDNNGNNGSEFVSLPSRTGNMTIPLNFQANTNQFDDYNYIQSNY